MKCSDHGLQKNTPRVAEALYFDGEPLIELLRELLRELSRLKLPGMRVLNMDKDG
jgi:hypothetical protein